jgi:hypothetical protein
MSTVPGDRGAWRPAVVVLLALVGFVLAPFVAVLLPFWIEDFPAASGCFPDDAQLAAARAVEEAARPWTAVGATVSAVALVGWLIALDPPEAASPWEGFSMFLVALAGIAAAGAGVFIVLDDHLSVLWTPVVVVVFGLLNVHRVFGRCLALIGVALFLVVGGVAATGWSDKVIC